MQQMKEFLTLDWLRRATIAVLLAIGLYVVLVIGVTVARAGDLGGSDQIDLAQDLEKSKKAPWTGAWASVNLAYTMQSTEIGPFAFDANAVSYGVGVGYDLQIRKVVLGVMADHDWTKADSVINDFSRSWFVGARAGWLPVDNALIYGLVGYSSLDGTIPAGFETYKGLTLGGGMEVMPGKNWSVKVEYRHVDLGSDPVFGPFTADHSQHQGRLGLVYRFGK